jgi:hypothetical protein
MGQIHVSPLSNLADGLRRVYHLTTFVETGTFMGGATGWAARVFETVYTIEIRADFQEQAKKNTGSPPNIHFLLGDSKDRLAEVCAKLDAPALFWLDAHAGAGHFGSEERCPLLAELEAIVSGQAQHFVLIDDARAFTAPPPPPFDYRLWPSLDEVLKVLAGRHSYHVVLIEDCLVCVPQSARELLAQFVFHVRPTI